ncbi:MAG: hypothetical protein R2878_03050 [Thermoleophilia bacterium]
MLRLARTGTEAAEIAGRVDRWVALDAEYPSWMFRRKGGYVSIFEADSVEDCGFGRIVAGLARTYRDEVVSVIEVGQAHDRCGVRDGVGVPSAGACTPYWGFEIVVDGDVAADYAAAPWSDNFPVLNLRIAGSSGRWSLWADRIGTEIGVLFTADSDGPWKRDPEILMLPIDEGLDAFEYWPEPRKESCIAGEEDVFRCRLHAFGTGPSPSDTVDRDLPGLGRRFRVAGTQDEFRRMAERFDEGVSLDARLPAQWPFPGQHGWTTILNGRRVLTGGFGGVLKRIAEHYGDDTVVLIGTNRHTRRFPDQCGVYPGFEINCDDLPAGYLDALLFQHGASPASTFKHNLDTIALTGTTGEWLIWGHACKDRLGLLLTKESLGPWTDEHMYVLTPESVAASVLMDRDAVSRLQRLIERWKPTD